jgi:hypothetical protein
MTSVIPAQSTVDLRHRPAGNEMLRRGEGELSVPWLGS